MYSPELFNNVEKLKVKKYEKQIVANMNNNIPSGSR